MLDGNDRLQLLHGFHTAVRHTGGVPAEPEVPLQATVLRLVQRQAINRPEQPLWLRFATDSSQEQMVK